jgi:hypothetical protein
MAQDTEVHHLPVFFDCLLTGPECRWLIHRPTRHLTPKLLRQAIMPSWFLLGYFGSAQKGDPSSKSWAAPCCTNQWFEQPLDDPSPLLDYGSIEGHPGSQRGRLAVSDDMLR